MDLHHATIHTFTTKPWSIDQCIDGYARHGFGGISVWRETVAGQDLGRVRKKIADAGLQGVSLVRGGFFTGATVQARQAAIVENRKAIDEAEALGLTMIVLVCGATPGQIPSDNFLQIEQGIEEILPYAEAAGIKLAVEPLHPMYAADRACINTMEHALDICDELDPGASGAIGVAVEPDRDIEIAQRDVPADVDALGFDRNPHKAVAGLVRLRAADAAEQQRGEQQQVFHRAPALSFAASACRSASSMPVRVIQSITGCAAAG